MNAVVVNLVKIGRPACSRPRRYRTAAATVCFISDTAAAVTIRRVIIRSERETVAARHTVVVQL